MAGLLDFIQGASNAAAGTVAGPVDLINMGLLGVGLPMPRNPVGGSQWMRERGLMREPQNRTAGLLGEAAGGVLPIVAAAKAPQIAQGLLNHADAYRKYHAATTAPGAPATVWHGSPHRFDKFDSSKIGTGEGAQAYGHGLYLAESPEVARTYMTAGGRQSGFDVIMLDGKPFNPDALTSTQRQVASAYAAEIANGKSAKDAAAATLNWLKGTRGISQRITADEASKVIGRLTPTGSAQGNLYKVDLPDDAIARMLDWDAPLSKQPEAVRVAARDLGLPAGTTGKDIYNALAMQARDVAITRGNNAATTLGASQAAASNDLLGFGVPGVRYFDGGSRTAGTGTRNYVVFPGNEGLLKILGRE